jgi:hypothetical protein
MCWLLRVASPLTLSEIRSMLPAGLSAEAREPAELRSFQRHLPDALTAVALLHGACSCDLVVPRPADPKDDDAELRRRYHALKASRAATIRALERHAAARELRKHPAAHWPAALHRFVAEHARTAGPTLYHLAYVTDPDAHLAVPRAESSAGVPSAHDHAWLAPDTLVRVVP